MQFLLRRLLDLQMATFPLCPRIAFPLCTCAHGVSSSSDKKTSPIRLGPPCVCVSVCERVSVKSLSHIRLSTTLWTVARQAPLSMGFSRQEYWGGLPFPSPGDRPDAGTEPTSLMPPVLAGGFFTTAPARKPQGHPHSLFFT